jgi:hypothetical protein
MVKEFRNWKGTIDEYLKVGDVVDEAFRDYFATVLPALHDNDKMVQMGEPYKFINKKGVFLTLKNTPEGWVFQKDNGMTNPKPEGIPIELADCIIRIFDYCGKEGINIEEAIRIKHEYNKTRPYRHGGKAI